MTQFMLNRSVQAVFVPICLLTCQSLGAAPMGLVMCVASACQTAFHDTDGDTGSSNVYGRRRI